MKKELQLIRYVRKNIMNVIEGHSLEQLNTVPEKFNNNIAWNLAHFGDHASKYGLQAWQFTAHPWHRTVCRSGVEDATKITCVHEGRHYELITSLLKLVL